MGRQTATPLSPRSRSERATAAAPWVELKPIPQCLTPAAVGHLVALPITFAPPTEEQLDLRENADRSSADCRRTDRLFLAAASAATALLAFAACAVVHFGR